jgi:Rrf2 family protein
VEARLERGVSHARGGNVKCRSLCQAAWKAGARCFPDQRVGRLSAPQPARYAPASMITQKTRYALRSLLFLAEEQGGAPVQLGRIAETQRVPPKYLELIMLDLKKAGLVKSARGPKGGYQLSRPSQQISFGEVVRTMEGPIALVSCASVNFYAPCGDCQDEATCAIRRAFAILRDQSTTVLDSISLAQGAGWEERLGTDA